MFWVTNGVEVGMCITPNGSVEHHVNHTMWLVCYYGHHMKVNYECHFSINNVVIFRWDYVKGGQEVLVNLEMQIPIHYEKLCPQRPHYLTIRV